MKEAEFKRLNKLSRAKVHDEDAIKDDESVTSKNTYAEIEEEIDSKQLDAVV